MPVAALTPTLETALVVSYSQIVDGEIACEYCANPADVMLSTGADPEECPICWTHARQMVTISVATMDQIFGHAA